MVEKYYRIYVPVHLPEGCLQGMGIFNNLFLKGKKKKGKNGKCINVYKCMSGRYKSDSPKGGVIRERFGNKFGQNFGKDFQRKQGEEKGRKKCQLNRMKCVGKTLAEKEGEIGLIVQLFDT